MIFNYAKYTGKTIVKNNQPYNYKFIPQKNTLEAIKENKYRKNNYLFSLVDTDDNPFFGGVLALKFGEETVRTITDNDGR